MAKTSSESLESDGAAASPRCSAEAIALHNPTGYLFKGKVAKPFSVRPIRSGGGSLLVVLPCCNAWIIDALTEGGPTIMNVVGFGALAPK